MAHPTKRLTNTVLYSLVTAHCEPIKHFRRFSKFSAAQNLPTSQAPHLSVLLKFLKEHHLVPCGVEVCVSCIEANCHLAIM